MLLQIISIIILLVTTSAFGNDKLIFSLDLIRHGDRTSLVEIPAIPHKWKEGGGELTSKGMLQEFQLGLKFRKKYIEETKLLSETYNEDEIYVRSTNFNRTVMSAQSVLLGLYSPDTGSMLANLEKPVFLSKEIQPIPINIQDAEYDEIISFATNSAYKIRNKVLYKKYSYALKSWKEQTFAMQDPLKVWSQKLNMTLANLDDLIKIADTLYVYQNHGVLIPEEVLSQDDVDHIIRIGLWAHAVKYAPKEIGGTFGSNLLSTITKYMQQANRRAPSKLKYVLLSGHDSSILSVLSAMQAPLNENPRYASDLNFSMYESENKQRFIVVSLNDQPVSIPHCSGSSCSVEQFSELLEIAKQNRDMNGLHCLHLMKMEL